MKFRDYEFALTVGAFKRIASRTGTDILTDETGQSVGRLMVDPVFLSEVCTAVLAPQLTERGITPDAFLDSLTGEDTDIMRDVFFEAYPDFFPAHSRDKKREAVGAMMTKIKELESGNPSMSTPE